MQKIRSDIQHIRGYTEGIKTIVDLDIIESSPIEDVRVALADVKDKVLSIEIWCGIIENDIAEIAEAVFNVITRLSTVAK